MSTQPDQPDEAVRPRGIDCPFCCGPALRSWVDVDDGEHWTGCFPCNVRAPMAIWNRRAVPPVNEERIRAAAKDCREHLGALKHFIKPAGMDEIERNFHQIITLYLNAPVSEPPQQLRSRSVQRRIAAQKGEKRILHDPPQPFRKLTDADAKAAIPPQPDKLAK